MEPKRHLRIYDHRLVQFVLETRDPSIATRLGVPRSTLAGWLRQSAPVSETSGGGKYGGGGPDTTGKMLRDLLAEAAPKLGAEAVPAWSNKEAGDWEGWFAKNQKHFAAKLGKYGVEELRKAKH